ncbi:hypothetical protein ACFP81_04830 [Deinococcus lacus]|uniref:Uncharacterized protein n=1 Tax=Deinococcus lacus TaxID=392561 RepID=A0ABW1YD64_9DEIO
MGFRDSGQPKKSPFSSVHVAYNYTDFDKSLELLLQSFGEACNLIAEKYNDRSLLLVLPLRALGNQVFATYPANLKELSTECDEFEPPSLYLLDRKHNINTEFVEEHVKPISFFELIPNSEGLRAYYREWRDFQNVSQNWEYSRAIYIQYYLP